VQRAPAALLRPYVKAILVVHMQPSPKLFEAGAILVNRDGARFCDETVSVLDLSHQPEAKGFVVLDATTGAAFSKAPNFVSTAPGVGYAYLGDYAKARPDLVHRAEDAPTLAAKLGVDPATLAASLASSRLKPPYIALGPVLSTVTVTEGGCAVDESCRVLRPDGAPIPGLFAAGGVGQGGMRLAGHGFHIGWAMISGRLSGRAAARRVPRGSAWAPPAAREAAE
jgi:fumarate reductase flavoprotein subunit